ncbi:MAG: FecR family protein [Chitinophagaceae bacterium]
MTNERIYYLIDRILHGTHTSEELEEYLRWLETHSGKPAAEEEETSCAETDTRYLDEVWAQIRPVERKMRTKRTGYVLAAASVLAVILTIFLLRDKQENSMADVQNKKENKSAIAQHSDPDSYQLRASKDTSASLPDGSVVKMKAGAVLKWYYNETARLVYMDGEVFYDVKKDAEHPFIVHTASMAVRALGTSFTVSDQNHGSRVLLKTGKVAVWESDSVQFRRALQTGTALIVPKDIPVVYLDPGESATANGALVKHEVIRERRSSSNAKKSIVNTWFISHDIKLEAASLETVVTALNKAVGKQVIAPDLPANDQLFSGTFRSGENLERALNRIAVLYGVKILKKEQGFFIAPQ